MVKRGIVSETSPEPTLIGWPTPIPGAPPPPPAGHDRRSFGGGWHAGAFAWMSWSTLVTAVAPLPQTYLIAAV